MSSVTESAEAIRAVLARLNRAENDLAALGVEGVIKAIDEILAPDWVGGGSGQQPHGRAEERETERALFTAFPDYHRTLDNIVVEPPLAVLRWTIRATHTGDFLGIPASGRKIETTGMSLFELEGGRVQRSSVYFDIGGFIQQMIADPAI